MYSWAEKGICHIVGGGDFCRASFRPEDGDLVIAADRGYEYLTEIGFVPDLVIGDFDSLGHMPSHANVISLPQEKDDTDTMYAVKTGLSRGYQRFYLHGVLGGERMDHSIASIQTLLFLTARGAKGRLLGKDGTVMAAVHNGGMSFPPTSKGLFSVFCVGDKAEGVTLSGVKYPLTHEILTNDIPIGTSNEFVGLPAEVRVEKGTLLVIWKE